MILALFVSAVLHPTKDQLNSISKHNHSITSQISELLRSNTSYPTSWIALVQEVMEKRMGPQNSTWDYRRPTILAVIHLKCYYYFFHYCLFGLKCSINALPSVRRLKLLLNIDIDTKDKSQTYRVIRK